MRIIIQRVNQCEININNKVHSQIINGLLVLLGIGKDTTEDDINYLIRKLLNLRIFNDKNDIPNLSIEDIKGELMIVSQFTLYAATKKGNRPSYINAAAPPLAEEQFNLFVSKLKKATQLKVQTGVFGAHMQINLINDGPYTLFIDSKNRA